MTADLKWHWVAEEEGIILMTADLEKRVAELARRLGLTGEYVGKVRPLLDLAYEVGWRDGREFDPAPDSTALKPAAKKKGEKP